MKKVLILTTVHKADDVRIFYKEILSIKKLPVQVYFVVPHSGDEAFELDGIKITPIPKAKNILSRFFISQFIAAKKIFSIKPNIIHFHDPELIPLVLFCKYFIKARVIFDIHENITASFKEKTWIPGIIKGPLTFFYPRIEKLLIGKFDFLIIAENSYEKVYGKRAVKILNYPVWNQHHIYKKNFNETITFVYAGSITELRGIFEMLKIFQILLKKTNKKLQLNLVGDYYPESLEYEVKKIIQKYKIENYVNITGRLKMSGVYNILENSHIGFSILAPIQNHLGSLPTKVFEYMMFGLPSIVSDFPVYNEYGLNDETVVKVDYYDIDSTAMKIIELLNNIGKLEKMSEKGIELVKTKYNWKSEEEKLLKLYNKLLNI